MAAFQAGGVDGDFGSFFDQPEFAGLPQDDGD